MRFVLNVTQHAPVWRVLRLIQEREVLLVEAVWPWLRSFIPAPLSIGRREWLYACFGAWLGICGTEWICHHALGASLLWFIAPMGASAVLLFAVPASPLAQPWSIVGGNVLAALIGVLVAHWFGHSGLAAGLALALTIGAMFALRCVHPPGGAVALTAVLGGEAVQQLGFGFVLWPVAANSLMLLLIGLLFNNLLRRRYPHRQQEQHNPHHTRDPLPNQRLGVQSADLDAILAARGEWLDIDKDDLREIVQQVEQRAYQRRFGAIRCADIMSRDIYEVTPQTSMGEVWQLLQQHHIKAVPVVGGDGVLLGIVSLHDFVASHAAGPDGQARSLFDSARAVGEIMTSRVICATPQQGLAELVVLFSDAGRHHLPVVDAQRRVVGMLTQSDMLAALFRSGLEQAL